MGSAIDGVVSPLSRPRWWLACAALLAAGPR